MCKRHLKRKTVMDLIHIMVHKSHYNKNYPVLRFRLLRHIELLSNKDIKC